MEGAGPHFHIQRLEDHAALFGPVLLQGQDQALKGFHIDFGGHVGSHYWSGNRRRGQQNGA